MESREKPGWASAPFRGCCPIARQPTAWYSSGQEVNLRTRGGQVSVAVTRNTIGDAHYAIKSLDLDYAEYNNAAVDAEISTHRWLSHPAVPPLRDVFVDEGSRHLHMVFDYGGEPLLDHVARDGSPEAASFNAALALEATCTMLEVLTQLHAAGYSYNDLKPEQLLVSATSAAAGGPAVMMVDFGAVTQIGAMQRLGNTWTFCPPEAHRRMASGQGKIEATFGEAFDAWALALTAAVTALGGRNPYSPSQRQLAAPAPYACVLGCGWSPHFAANVLNDPRAYEKTAGWQLLSDELREFVAMGLRQEPSRRATLAQLAGSAWGRRALSLGAERRAAAAAAGAAGGAGARAPAPASRRASRLDPEQAAPEPAAGAFSSSPTRRAGALEAQPSPTQPLPPATLPLARSCSAPPANGIAQLQALAAAPSGAAAAPRPALRATAGSAPSTDAAAPDGAGAPPPLSREQLRARVDQLEADIRDERRRSSRHDDMHSIENEVLLATLEMTGRQLEVTECRLAEAAEREEGLRADNRRLRRERDDARARLVARHAAAASEAAALFDAARASERRAQEERRAARDAEGELREELQLLRAQVAALRRAAAAASAGDSGATSQRSSKDSRRGGSAAAAAADAASGSSGQGGGSQSGSAEEELSGGGSAAAVCEFRCVRDHAAAAAAAGRAPSSPWGAAHAALVGGAGSGASGSGHSSFDAPAHARDAVLPAAAAAPASAQRLAAEASEEAGASGTMFSCEGALSCASPLMEGALHMEGAKSAPGLMMVDVVCGDGGAAASGGSCSRGGGASRGRGQWWARPLVKRLMPCKRPEVRF